MSVPDPALAPSAPSPHVTDLAVILDAAGQHRLHAAMVLVGVHRVPAPIVLDLLWSQIHPAPREIRAQGLTVHLDPATVDLFHWHGARQRLDRRRAGPVWHHSVRVVVDATGRPYSQTGADEAVTIAAARAGLPPLTLEGLRALAA